MRAKVQEKDPAEKIHRIDETAVACVLVFLLGSIVGTYEIANSSFGWHLASGRVMLEEREILRSDPFSFTAAGTPWIDHEWLFQVALAGIDKLGGAPAMVIFRGILVAFLAGLLLYFGLRSGLAPPLALILASFCLYGARMRFYLRPELFTLLIVPCLVWLFLHRRCHQRPGSRWYFVLFALMVLAVNLHGAALVVLPLLGCVLTFEVFGLVIRRAPVARAVLDGGSALLVLALAACINPWGWRIFTVPLKLMELVGLPQIPNPEWISPSPADVPALYVGLGLSLLLLVFGERDLRRWALGFCAAYLALRYVRNVGLFFMLMPVVVGPALSRLLRPEVPIVRPGFFRWMAAVTVLVVGVATFADSKHKVRFALSETWYPKAACEFMEKEDLIETPIYNDVRFGGYLLQRYFPSLRIFIDDRNEIHEPMLAEIYEVLQSSNPSLWTQLLRRHNVETALVRYNPPFRFVSVKGEDLGYRGFAALWYQRVDWALVYWDDVAMVFVHRSTTNNDLLERAEYHLIVPDDLGYIKDLMISRPDLRPLAAAEIARKLEEDPTNQHALDLGEFLMLLTQGYP